MAPSLTPWLPPCGHRAVRVVWVQLRTTRARARRGVAEDDHLDKSEIRSYAKKERDLVLV